MKFKNLLIYSIVFALVAVGTSCSKPSEKNIIGKWQLVSFQYHDITNPEWREFVEPNETIIGEFKSDGKVDVYKDGVLDYTTIWSYIDGVIMFDHFNYNMEEYSSKKMVWFDRESNTYNGEESWFEERRVWEKAK